MIHKNTYILPSFLLPSFQSALELRVSFNLLNNLTTFLSVHPRLIVWFLNNLVFTV
jgi:hypothetical protein